MNTIFIFHFFFTLTVLFVILILPFWLLAPKRSKDSRLIKDVLPPKRYRYTLLLPEGYSESEPVPLIVALHYGDHGSPYFGETILTLLVEPALRTLGAMMVAPDCPRNNWLHPDSESYILDLMDYLQGQYRIDPGQILVVGYSMGGRGVWRLAASYPERFSAALVMAGIPPENAAEIEWQIPLYVIHGRKDEHFPVHQTSRMIARLEERGVDVTYRILEGVAHYETHRFVDSLRDAIPWIRRVWGIR